MISLRSAFSSRLLRAIALAVVFGLSLPSPARADFSAMGPALLFAVLGQFSNNNTSIERATITGDIGIGTLRSVSLSNTSVMGNVRFSGASETSGLTPDPDPGSNPGPFTVSGGGTVSGGVVINDLGVTNALNAVNAYSQTVGGHAGTDLTLTSTQTIIASNGILDVDGNRVFDTASVNLNNGTILTIDGAASDFVVVNVTDNNPNFNGQIVLTGGITPDHVLFNMFGGDYATHKGGPTLTISTSAQITRGIFLDPNGGMTTNESTLNGRFFGGDVQNQQIVSGVNITAPQQETVPEPASLLTLALALGGLVFCRRKLDTSAK